MSITETKRRAARVTWEGSLYHPALTAEDYHPKVIAYYYKRWDGFDMVFHQHLAVEIMYAIEGSCKVETDDDEIEMKKGEFILLDSHVPHRLIVPAGNPCRMLNIEYIFVKSEAAYPSMKVLSEDHSSLGNFLTTGKPYYVHKDPGVIYPILRSLVSELDDSSRESDWTVQLLMGQLMLKLAQLLGDDGVLPEALRSHYVQQALQYIHQHYDVDLKVEDMAAAVNVHPGYLHRIFKASTGRTPVQYLTDYRMDKAKMLLTNTNIPISDIADYVGLNSRQYFSALFKRYTGQKPVEYRKAAESWVRDEE